MQEGALTDHLVRTYCTGINGVEVGPGSRPYGPAGTVLIDRYEDFGGANLMDALGDAAHLPVADSALDYLISSHCLEHQIDTLCVLDEWRRVLKLTGVMFLVLPHPDRTFDNGRPLHDFAHHDAERGLILDPAVDDGHWLAWEAVLDRTQHEHHPWSPSARLPDGSWDRRWMADAALVHYHAWTQHEMTEILLRTGWRIHFVCEELPERSDSFCVIASPFDKD